MSQQALVKGIYDLLIATTTVPGFFEDMGGRIFDTQADLDEPLPLVTFQIISDVPRLDFAKAHIDALVQLDLYSERTRGGKYARDINDLVYDVMHTGAPTVAGFSGVIMHNVERGFVEVVEDVVHIRSQFQIHGTEN